MSSGMYPQQMQGNGYNHNNNTTMNGSNQFMLPWINNWFGNANTRGSQGHGENTQNNFTMTDIYGRNSRNSSDHGNFSPNSFDVNRMSTNSQPEFVLGGDMRGSVGNPMLAMQQQQQSPFGGSNDNQAYPQQQQQQYHLQQQQQALPVLVRGHREGPRAVQGGHRGPA